MFKKACLTLAPVDLSRCRLIILEPLFVTTEQPTTPQRPVSDLMSSAALGELLPAIETALAEACHFSNDCPDRLADAIRYSLLAPGKRLRPALVLMAGEAVCGDANRAMPAAVAVEMVHAYSLVHDDLPAMDDDDLRRGRPTTHVQFDEATAILAGDSLLAMAFAQLAEAIADPVLAHRCVRVLGQAAGPQGLVGGQSDDLAAERGGVESSLGQVEAIHRRKTGALFNAAVKMGGILGGGDLATLDLLEQYSRPFGLAFQVVDDCLDHTATAQQMGKRTGKDAARGKLTYPGLMGLDPAWEYADQLIQQALAPLQSLGDRAWRLRWLAQFVRDRKH